jgi:hypothetical protein
MCITQCKFLILLYLIVFNCELCVTQSVNCVYILILLQTIMTKDWQMTDPTSRQRGRPQMTGQWLKKKMISGQKSQIGLDTKTYWLTDRQLQGNTDANVAARQCILLPSTEEAASRQNVSVSLLPNGNKGPRTSVVSPVQHTRLKKTRAETLHTEGAYQRKHPPQIPYTIHKYRSRFTENRNILFLDPSESSYFWKTMVFIQQRVIMNKTLCTGYE